MEEEEWSKINGCDADGQKVLANKSDASTPANLYWLHMKYKGIHFVDQNPEDDTGSGAPLADESKWEHRVILRVVHSGVRKGGHNVESCIFNHPTGMRDHAQYNINGALHAMIKASPRNTHVRFASAPPVAAVI